MQEIVKALYLEVSFAEHLGERYSPPGQAQVHERRHFSQIMRKYEIELAKAL